MDVFAVTDTLVEHIKAHYADDIALAAYYGSYAQGTETKRSDLDFFFIPATPEGYGASLQFILGGISFDFWPISWERAARMASFEEAKTTIIADCRLLYVRSDEDYARFIGLREHIAVKKSEDHRLELTERAEAMLRECYVHLYKMSRGGAYESLSFFRTESYEVFTKAAESLALLNQTYFTRGWGKNKDLIMRLPSKPAMLEQYYKAITESKDTSDIQSACANLVEDTLQLIVLRKESLIGAEVYAERLKGFFEETKGTLDKIVTACEQNDYDTAFFSAVRIQDDIAYFLYLAEKGHAPCMLKSDMDHQSIYRSIGLPDLVSLLERDHLAPLQTAVEQLEEMLEKHLRDRGVAINQFANVSQLAAFLDGHSRKDRT